jgi:HEAT repeat protein
MNSSATLLLHTVSAWMFASSCLAGSVSVQTPTNIVSNLTFEQVVVSIRANGEASERVRQISYDYRVRLKEFSVELLEILNDPKAPNLNRCMAAHYLGEMRSVEAIDALVANMTLELDLRKLMVGGLPLVSGRPAQDALINIGSPAMLALMRNLEQADDAKVRAWTLLAIYRIDKDKDIVQLRLRKAFDSQKVAVTKFRLQLVLDELSKPEFGK